HALEALDAHRIAVVTPYVDSVTDRLLSYLDEHGVGVTSSVGLGLLSHIWRGSYAEVFEAVRSVDHPDAQAIFLSCTNVLTYDILAPLDREPGRPDVPANPAPRPSSSAARMSSPTTSWLRSRGNWANR